MSYNKAYSKYEHVFGSEPDPFLVKHYEKINPDLPVLDIGAGQGRNSFFLAERGYSVDAIDPSAVAIETIQNRIKQSNLNINILVTDFQDFDPGKDKYGGILVFGLIQILNREQIKNLVDSIDTWLAQGGLLFVSAFTVEDETGGPINSENITYLEHGELVEIVKPYEVVYHWEGLGPEHHHGDGILERHAKVEAVFQKK